MTTLTYNDHAFSVRTLPVLICILLPAVALRANDPQPDQNAEFNVTPDKPFPELSQLIRDQRSKTGAQGATVIRVAPGTYHLDQPITIDAKRIGPVTAESPLVLTGPENADSPAILSGGVRITDWETTELAGRTAWVAELPDVREGKWYFRQLFVNSERRPRPRVPDEGFYRFTGLPTLEPNSKYAPGQDRATFKPGDIRPWANITDVELVILHYWVAPRMQIAEVRPDENLVILTQPTARRLTSAFDVKEFARYYADNVVEALDSPGEWYLDRSTGRLTYLPRDGETPDNTTVVAPRAEQFLRIVGDNKDLARHITIRNLTFAHTEWYDARAKSSDGQAAIAVPAAIHFENARQCTIDHCTIRNVGTYAVEVATGCHNIAISNNTLTDLGAGGVKIQHGTHHNTVTDNVIVGGGRLFHNAVGIWLGRTSDNLVAHNEVRDLYWMGVSVGWNWGYAPSQAARNVIEFNHIHHLGQGWLSDIGGVYTLGISPGTVIRNNLIHDIEADAYGGWGLYTDEGSSHIVMENNIVYNTTHGGFHQHYGRENIIRNNILAFGRHAQIARTREEDHNSFTFERNIVIYNEGQLFGSNWSNNNFIIDLNCYWRTDDNPVTFPGGTFEAWQARGHDRHSIIANPNFKDPENTDFTLSRDSPAIKLGFRPIDTNSIGPRP